MEMPLSTPALLFSTISLLMLAYTNRFLAIARLIRDLHDKYTSNPSEHILAQIKNLRTRLLLIRNMQFLGVSSLLGSTICIFLLFYEKQSEAKTMFVVSLILMVVSLLISVVEITISIEALKIELRDIEEKNKSFLDKLFNKD